MDQQGHTHPQPNGQAGGASPRTVRLRTHASSPRPSRQSPRHAERSPRPGGSRPRPAQSSTVSGPGPRPDSGLLLAHTEELFELIAYSQSQRLDDQRASISRFPELSLSLPGPGNHHCGACSPQGPGEDFFNMLMKYQSCRIEDQRCLLPDPDGSSGAASEGDEDLFSMIQRVQARRMDEQRALLNTDGQQASGGHPEAKPATGPG